MAQDPHFPIDRLITPNAYFTLRGIGPFIPQPAQVRLDGNVDKTEAFLNELNTKADALLARIHTELNKH